MFVHTDEKKPIKIWLQSKEDLEDACLEQAKNLANLPFIHKHVALMPDAHSGYGMPVGGVIATKGVIIPNAVGVDIGCGMAYIGTNLKLDDIKDVQTKSGTLIQVIIGDWLRNIPVGFAKHQKPQVSGVLDRAKEELDKYEANQELLPFIEAGYYQVGTLGGGNHFLELQVDDEGFIGIMVHSGSRHFGKQICDLFNKKAKMLNERWYSVVPSNQDLAFLPTDSEEGKQYINWMNLALDYAYENRSRMITVASELFVKHVLKHTGIEVKLTEEINCHHNYAAIENHYGQNVWVHRKGATRVREGEIALIPGAMGSYSYVVEGLGNPESFHSCSHGAGRQYSRKAALEKFSTEEVILDLKAQGVVLGKHNKADVAEESRFAYKDIDLVMDNQKDLVKAIKRLKTVGVIKG
jgi:tRNA-splicing ligase RtcB